MYDYISKSYDELHREEQLKKLSVIKSALNIKSEDTVLDIGCGTGISFLLGCKVVGIDCSKAMLEECRGRIDAVYGFAESLPFPAKSFDKVICVTAIHNFSGIRTAIREMKRVARKHIAISVLKKSGKFSAIKSIINEELIVERAVDTQNDLLYFCSADNRIERETGCKVLSCCP